MLVEVPSNAGYETQHVIMTSPIFLLRQTSCLNLDSFVPAYPSTLSVSVVRWHNGTYNEYNLYDTPSADYGVWKNLAMTVQPAVGCGAIALYNETHECEQVFVMEVIGAYAGLRALKFTGGVCNVVNYVPMTGSTII